MKTLIVIHRTLREGDPTFREELLSFSRRAKVLHISNFKDDSSSLGKLTLCCVAINYLADMTAVLVYFHILT